MLTKAKAEGVFKKKGNKPKYPFEMDLVHYPPKFKQLERYSYFGNTSAYWHIIHFNSLVGGMTGIVNNDALKIRLFLSTLKGVASNW